MLTIGAQELRSIALPQSGVRRERQQEIIEGMGDSFSATLDEFEINTPLRIAHFLAQVAHESDGLCTTEEYASGLAYENRRDLGNTNPGDGPLFKGRGLIQLTGRANYRTVGGELDLDLEGQPLSISNPFVYLRVSCVFWRQRGINAHCDADDLISVTHLVNGGLNGLDDRRDYLVKAKALVAALQAGGAQPPGQGLTVLHRGSDGDAVTLLQKRLTTLGYPVALDANFGPGTEVAVRHFQAAAGLAADGVVGAETWAKIEAAVGAG